MYEAAEKFWDTETKLGEVTKGNTGHGKFVISRVSRNGKEYINVHEWYQTIGDPTWKPAKGNLSIPVENFDDFRSVLQLVNYDR